MNNFITNSSSNNLKERLSELITISEELKFLVGFFYFSSLKVLFESLKKNPNVIMKVLVGLNVDKLNYQLIEFADQEDESGNSSNEKVFQKYCKSLIKSINTEKFDTKEFYVQSKFFINLIKENKLIIRKTLKPNHSKIYLFKLQRGQIGRNALFITGSSNLTGAGLSTQNEFNVEISDYGVEDAEKYFDGLWENSIKITEKEDWKTRLIDIIEKHTLIKGDCKIFCVKAIS